MTTILETRHIPWPDEAACAASAAGLAVRLALRLADGAGSASASAASTRPETGADTGTSAVIELHGPLGAGKTTFARHLLRALGVEGAVKSPTYTLMEPYVADAAHGHLAIAHFDFYRFDDPNEWEEAGFRDVFAAPGLKLVEWPEKAEGLLPVPDLAITITSVDAASGLDDRGSDDSDRSDLDRPAPRGVRFEARTPVGVALLP